MSSRLHALVLIAVFAACHRDAAPYPKTPELTLVEVERAVIAADGAKAWALVDPQTRATVADVRRAMADPSDDKTFFAAKVKAWEQLEGYRKRLGACSGPIQQKPDGGGAVWVSRTDGMPFHLVKAGDGWAWQDLFAEWTIERDRVSKKQ